MSYAHPDDESFIGSGLAMQCHTRGWETVLVTATLGQRGKRGDPPVCRPEEIEECREAELREAARIIGLSHVHLLGYRDQELASAPVVEMRRALVSLVRRHKPAVVLTFDPNGFNAHPDHMAIARFTMDAVSAAADPRWEPDAGPAHLVSRLLWTPPITPWDAVHKPSLDAEPGIDFLVDVSEWRAQRAAALRAHRSQHLSIDRCFFSRPDVDRMLSVEAYRQAWGPALARRPETDVLAGL
jgi:LmbE family N-acetylglucosaminyl deacetylase